MALGNTTYETGQVSDGIGVSSTDGCVAVCIDPSRPANFFVGDWSSLRYVDTANNMVSLFAGSQRTGAEDGIGEAASFNTISDLLCITSSGKLIVTCQATHSIHLFDPTSGHYTLLAGGCEDDDAGWADGTAETRAKFDTPTDVAVIDSEQCVFITEKGNHRIWRMNLPSSLF